MKKGKLLTLISMVCISMLIGCSSNSTSENNAEVTWRIGHEEIQGGVMDELALRFKDNVEKNSNGRITVDIYRSGEIGSVSHYMEFLQDGLLNFALINPGTSSVVVPENNMFDVHYVLPAKDEDIKEALNDSAAIEKLNAINEKHKLHVHGWFMEGYNAWTTTNKEVKEPKDMKGIKIRTMGSPLIINSYNAYGANPTPMPYMEVFSGLQLKQINAQVNPIFAIEEMKFYEVQNYLIIAKQDVFVASAVSNSEFYKNLNDEDRKIADESMSEAIDYSFDVQKKLNEERLEKIKENSNIKVYELNAKEREKFEESAKKVQESYRKSTSKQGQEIFDEFLKEIEKYK